jgi:hypothetical protein
MTKHEMGRYGRVSFLGIVGTLGLVACGNATPAPATPTAEPKLSTASTYPKMAPLEEYLMDRDAEIALAKSAGPAPISSDATVLVLTKRGYEEAVKGKNGFVCMVGRAWFAPFDEPEFWNPKARSPVCLNAPAARSAMPVDLKRTELALAGLSREQMLARMRELIAQKAFPTPEIGSMSYMLSKQQYLSDSDVHWHPHLMFYMPGDMAGSVWGANLPGGSTVYGGSQEMPGGGYMPWTLFFVPVPKWSDGTPFEGMPGH